MSGSLPGGLPNDAGDNGRGPVVGVAASAGGPAAVAEVLAGLAGLPAPVLVIQHLNPEFVDGFVGWVAKISPLPVELARQGSPLRRGTVYVAPAGVHLKVAPSRHVVLDPDPPMLHRPSADQLFASLAEHLGRSAVGVVLSGMGGDGAQGLLALRERGGVTIAQDEASSAVFGMPRAAALAGAAASVLPLGEISGAIWGAVRRRR